MQCAAIYPNEDEISHYQNPVCTPVPGGHYQIVTGGNALGIDSIPLKLPGGQYAAGREGLFLFIALARMVTFCKEGAVRLLFWVLRA